MKLYYMAESPPCASVLMVFCFLDLPVELIPVDLSKGEQLADSFVLLNPLHTVPLLILDDGQRLNESRAIIAYLVDQFGTEQNQWLYPRNTFQRALVNQMLYFDATRLYSTQSLFLSPILCGESPDTKHEAQFRNNLTYLDGLLSDKEFVTGSNVTLADISIVAGLMFACAARFAFTDWPNIVRWLERMQQLKEYKQVISEPLTRFTGFLDSLKKASNNNQTV